MYYICYVIKNKNMTGNFINRLMENNNSKPVVGTYATIIHSADRTVEYVKSVSEDGKKVTMQRCSTAADLSKGPLLTGHQEWIHTLIDSEYELVFYRGKWCKKIVSFHFIDPDMSGIKLKKENPEVFNELYGNEIWPTKVIDGLTKAKTNYIQTRILFGSADYYYCWEI